MQKHSQSPGQKIQLIGNGYSKKMLGTHPYIILFSYYINNLIPVIANNSNFHFLYSVDVEVISSIYCLIFPLHKT